MKRLALLLPLLALAAAHAEDPATNAAPTFSRRVPLNGFGSAEIAPGWRISYGPDEATLDGIPKWSVCVYETAAPLDNRLLPERWHGLQPCEIAPALVPTNEVRILPVRGKPWLLRLSLEGIGVADGKNVRGEVAMSFHFFREIPRNPAAKTLSLADKAAVETILAESGQPFGDGWDLPEETKRQLEDAPASSEFHAENAESAEPKPHAKSAEGAE